MRTFIIPIPIIVVTFILAVGAYAGEPEKKIKNSLGMEFVLIQPGNFLMGSPKVNPVDLPVKDRTGSM